MASKRTHDYTESLLDGSDVPIYTDESGSLEGVKKSSGYFSDVPNFLWIEISLLMNVFLAGFDGTIAASTYATIGNEFKAIDLSPWITSSYLITSTAFQPLYGSISDILGRRVCIFFALSVFGLGCLACFLSESMIWLIFSRALTGIGGGGLICLSTITNSDIIHPKKRGMFQAVQNLMLGLGGIFGASFGGYLSTVFGWRLCFAIQLLPTAFSLVVATFFIPTISRTEESETSWQKEIFQKIDFRGAILLVSCLMAQLLVLTIGEDRHRWSSPQFMLLLLSAIVLTTTFFKFESNTKTIPIIPVNDYRCNFALSHVVINFLIGFANYSYIFALPLLFQIQLGDSASKAGFRLAIPSLATPVGGLISGYFMAKLDSYDGIALCGTLFMGVGNFLALFISKQNPNWIINMLLFPANMGVGLAYPTCLFIFIYFFDTAQQATSTATVYLMRNIGGVWGVSNIAIIIQTVLKRRLKQHLSQLPNLSISDVEEIIFKVVKSTEAITLLEPEVQNIVISDYTFSIKLSQVTAGFGCFIAFFLCLIARKI